MYTTTNKNYKFLTTLNNNHDYEIKKTPAGDPNNKLITRDGSNNQIKEFTQIDNHNFTAQNIKSKLYG